MLGSIHRLSATVLAVLLLAATAIPALAADEPILRGVVLMEDGRPFAVDEARVTLVAPGDGGVVANVFEVADDGSFEVPVMPWGTPGAPAQVRLRISGVVSTVVLNDDGCSEQYAPIAAATFTIALEGGGEPERVELTANEELIGTVCGGLAAPTLPPTDTEGVAAACGSGQPVAPVLLGLVAFLLVLVRADAVRRLAPHRPR